MWGYSGVQCLDCKAEWNYTWHSDNSGDLVVCPNCESLKVSVLNQTVPFKIGGGKFPEYIYNCICGGVFQYPPKIMPDPYETNLDILRAAKKVTCIFCGRNNEDPWHIH